MNPSPPGEPAPVALEDSILQVELRLIAREERLWRGVAEVQARTRAALNPRRLWRPLGVVAGVALAGAAAWWWLRGRSPARQVARQQAVGHTRWRSRVVTAVGLLAAVPWAPVMSGFWPLLPARLRRRTTPNGAASMLSVALPWVARFASPQHSLGGVRLVLATLNGLWSGLLDRQPTAGGLPPVADTRPG